MERKSNYPRMRIDYKRLERIARAHGCSFERGKDSDGPYARMGGKLGALQAAKADVGFEYFCDVCDTGFYFRPNGR